MALKSFHSSSDGAANKVKLESLRKEFMLEVKAIYSTRSESVL